MSSISKLFSGLAVFLLAGCTATDKTDVQWAYLGGDDRNHYSHLSQINTENVGKLQRAWTYHSGDSGQVQCNPLVVGDRFFGITASNYLFALDAATGRELWRFEPDSTGPSQVNRGLAYWEKGGDRRIFFTSQSWLYAIDMSTGRPIPTFGEEGRISLRTGLGAESAEKFVVSTTPGTVYGDIIIMPIRVGENAGAAPGHIQAFNVVTGALEWVFHTIPRPGEYGYETWPEDAYKDPEIGGANNWAGMAVDRKRGIVYVPTGSAAFDFYGGNRIGENLFANSLLALNAETGAYIWHFQAVRHDIWDRDFPAPPNLVTITRDGNTIDAVAQITKTGHVFVFDRETGEPVFPIDEVAVPPSTLPGEVLWPTQPIPKLPRPFARQELTESDISYFSERRDSLLAIYRGANKGLFHPLDFNETIIFPGPDGGAEWGGAAVDQDGMMYVNSNEMAWLFSLSPIRENRETGMVSSGKQLYVNYCLSCHRADLSGNPASGYPALTDLREKMSRPDISAIIASGRGMMPGFTMINERERESIVNYILGEEKEEVLEPMSDAVSAIPYAFNGYNKFLDEDGYPAITPPWGTLTAVNLNTGEHAWQIPLGEFRELTERGIPVTGTENYGGPIVTAGGVLFIAATKDRMFRAFDKRTGELLWEAELPAAGFATPATYQVDGKQYVVVASGGTKLGTGEGDSYVAFSLP